MSTFPLLITQAEAAQLLGVSERTISRLVNRGALRTFQIDRHSKPRLRRSDVLALVHGAPDDRAITVGPDTAADMRIYLVAVTPDRVEFTTRTAHGWRPVTVLRHDPGPDPFPSLEFPHDHTDAGTTLGTADRDRAARLRAHEELVRMRAREEA